MIPTSDEIIGRLYRELIEATAGVRSRESDIDAATKRHVQERNALVAGHQAAMKAAGEDLDATRRNLQATIERLGGESLALRDAVRGLRVELERSGKYRLLGAEKLESVGYAWDAEKERWLKKRSRPRRRSRPV